MNILSIIGRIKSLEKRFLTAEEIEKLMNAKDFAEFTGILDKPWYDVSPGINSIKELIRIFENSRVILLEEMYKNLPHPLYHYFVLKYDYHNLYLLAEDTTGGENYTVYSTIDFNVLQEALSTNNYKNLPSFLKPPMSIIVRYKENNNLDVSLLLKKSYYETARKLIRTQGSTAIDYCLGIEIDFANAAVFIEKGISNTQVKQKHLIEGGNINKERFLKAEVLWKSFNKEYPGITTPIDTENYDSERYKLLMQYISRGRTMPYGIEPVFFYFLAREIELESIRRLAIGKLYAVTPKTLSQWGIYPYQIK